MFFIILINLFKVQTLDDFFGLMMRTRFVRRQIVERVLKGIPIRSHFAVSLKNAMVINIPLLLCSYPYDY